MISDEERREVAAKLRNGGIARDSKEAYTLLLSCVGIRPQLPATSTYEDAMVRLADLIDRPTAKGIIEDDGTSVCGHCGFRFDVSVEVSGCFSEVVLANHCPQCGRLLVWCDEVNE